MYATGSGAEPATCSPVLNMSVPFAPIPVSSQNGINLAYEIDLCRPTGQAPVIEKVEVLDPATGKVPLYRRRRPAGCPVPPGQLSRRPRRPSSGTVREKSPSHGYRSGSWSAPVPRRLLTHRLTLNRTADGLPPLTITGGDVAVRKDLSPVVVGSPMQGPGWLAMETTSPTTHHFAAQITMNGVTRVPQRCAQDWILLDPVTGQAASGNATLARNYYGFGREIHAVADGTVVAASDGLPDIETIYSAPPATIDTLAGNYVIVDIGNNKYTCYAHMVNGSVRVKPEDTVKEAR